MAAVSWPVMEPAIYPLLTGKEPCATGDPERFFPTSGGNMAVRRAKKECQSCPLVAECLAYGLSHYVDGVWGGSSELWRRKWRKEQRVLANPIIPEYEIDPEQVARMAERGMETEALARFFETTSVRINRILRLRRKRLVELEVIAS